jgi:hypothetical protein
MAKRSAQRHDPMHDINEDVLQPGNFTEWDEGASFLPDLGEVERQIEQLSHSDPARAGELYEPCIAGCTEKAGEVDDSDGEPGAFAGDLVELGRGGESLDSAWAEFRAHPSKFTCEDLLRYVSKAESAAWHEKAMAAAANGDLASACRGFKSGDAAAGACRQIEIGFRRSRP